MTTISPLRRRMIEDMMVRNLAPTTQQSYLYAVAQFSRFFGCSPDRLSVEDVRAYQVHLASKQQSWSHINQVACALRFFYGVNLQSFSRSRWSQILVGKTRWRYAAARPRGNVVR